MIDFFHILRRRLTKPDEGVAKLREHAAHVARVNIDIRAAQVAEGFPSSPAHRFEDKPHMLGTLELLPRDGEPELERCVETGSLGRVRVKLRSGKLLR